MLPSLKRSSRDGKIANFDIERVAASDYVVIDTPAARGNVAIRL